MKLLIPKEHGAYGQLGLPLVTALALGRPTWGGLCLAVAAFAAFFLHEPVLVMMGRRGVRLQRQHENDARQSVGIWAALAILLGGLGLWLEGEPALRAATIPLAFAVLLSPVTYLGWEKTLAGELAAAATLASASIPVAVSVGLPYHQVILVWVTWVVGFWASTAAVRWVIAKQKRKRALKELSITFLVVIAGAALASQHRLVLASAPYLLASWILVIRPPHARYLKRVGWTLIAAGVLTAAGILSVVHAWGA